MKSKKLTKLTKKQLASLPERAKKWIDLATTGKTDEVKAKEALLKCYKLGGLEAPKVVIFLDSPIKCLLGRFYAAAYLDHFLKRGEGKAQVDDQVHAQVDDQVYDQVYDQVDAQVYDQVDDQVYDQVYDQVDAQVHAQVYAQVYAQVRAQVDAQVRAQVRDQVSTQVRDQVYDQVDAQVRDQVSDQSKNLWQWYTYSIWWCAWLAYQETLCEFAKLDFKTEGIRDLFKARASWTWCYPEIAIICRMPKILRDEKGRLHSMTCKAVEYPDGYGVYYIHGVQFEEKQFLDYINGKIEAVNIMLEQNQDRKRVMVMEYGNEKLIQELKGEVMNEETDQQGNLMRVIRITNSNEADIVMYEGIDPAKMEKVYLRVPPEFANKTASEAKLWTFPVLWHAAQTLKQTPELLIEA